MSGGGEWCGEAAGFGEWESRADSLIPCGLGDGDDGGTGSSGGEGGVQELEVEGGGGIGWRCFGGFIAGWCMECEGREDFGGAGGIGIAAHAEPLGLDRPVGQSEAEEALGFHGP